MINKYNLYLITACFVFLSPLHAQITFTNDNSALNSITGFGYKNCAVDMNGDYLDDVVRITTDKIIFIDYQQEDGTFVQQSFDIGLLGTPEWSICAADIDGNGYNDLSIGSYTDISFIYADSTGTAYTEYLQPNYIFAQRNTFADIDNDGHLDAFVCSDDAQSQPFRNDGTGELTLDQSLIETVNLPGNYAAIWCDYDNDYDIDLYVSKCLVNGMPGDIEVINKMYRNNADGTYTEVGAEINMDDSDQSWATAFEDFDNDGDFDAFTINHALGNRFMRNDDGVFENIIASTNIPEDELGAFEVMGGDFNNDGWVDIFVQFFNGLYLNNGDLTFTAVQTPYSTGGIGDFNNDGFLDVINNNILMINDGNDNNWIKINTEGTVSNRNGIGARVEIHGDWGVQTREVRAGQGFGHMHSLTTHFGLGEANVVDELIVYWPSGVVTSIEDPDVNTTHLVVEQDTTTALVPPPELSNYLVDFNIGPNPVDEILFIHFYALRDVSVQLSVFDGSGKAVMSVSSMEYGPGKQEITLDVSGLAAGLYNLSLEVEGMMKGLGFVVK